MSGFSYFVLKFLTYFEIFIWNLQSERDGDSVGRYSRETLGTGQELEKQFGEQSYSTDEQNCQYSSTKRSIYLVANFFAQF